jgi:hypothetical protein
LGEQGLAGWGASLRDPTLGDRHPRARRVAIAITLGILAAIVVSWVALRADIHDQLGEDYQFFVDAASRWQSAGQVYLDRQLAGPYEAATAVDFLYPPPALALFVPFLYLPAPLWWMIPLGITAGHIVACRPVWWSWPILALMLWFPRTQSMIIWANTGMWVTALVALGVRFKWPSALIFVKPTFLPFALIGIRHRSWWIALAVMTVLLIPTFPLWLDYVTAMRNNVGDWPPGALYSIPDYVMASIPIVAWLARSNVTDPRLEPESPTASARAARPGELASQASRQADGAGS